MNRITGNLLIKGKGGGISLLQNYVLDKSILSDQEKEKILMALQGLIAIEDKKTDELLSKLGGLFQSKISNWIEVDFSDWVRTISVKLKFAPQAAFRVYDEFPDSITEDSDGNLYVTIDLPDNEVMYSYLFSFGNSVEVIEPKSVRDNIRKTLHLMLNKYNT